MIPWRRNPRRRSPAISSSPTARGSGSRRIAPRAASQSTAYLFARQIPIAPTTLPNGRVVTARDIGARHAGEIEYVFGALESVPKVTWESADRALSSQMLRYWSNFARTGNPNGNGLPLWPAYEAAKGNPVMTLDVTSKAAPEQHRARYEALDKPMR